MSSRALIHRAVVLCLALVACGTQPIDAAVEPMSATTSVARSSVVTIAATTSAPTAVTTSTTQQIVTTVAGAPFVVIAVTDGDTFRVRTPDGVEERVRLIGIDAPERNEVGASEAGSRLFQLLGSGELTLESDVSDRDSFGRLLRYAFVNGVFVNAVLVAEGLAVASDYPPDSARSEELQAAEEVARSAVVGIWAAPATTTIPRTTTTATTTSATGASPDVAISRVRFDADGNDNQNKNDEWVEITNDGPNPVDLTGWRLEDEGPNHVFRFPSGFSLSGGATVTVYSGCGSPSADALYFCSSGSAVWNNGGDTATLIDANGVTVDQHS